MNVPRSPANAPSSENLRVDLWSYDLSKPEDRKEFERLFDRLFLAHWKRRYPADYSSRRQQGFPEYVRGLYEEFLIDQARINGPRVLVIAKAINVLLGWSANGLEGAQRWRRFSTNIQEFLDGRRILISDERAPSFKTELRGHLKQLRRDLLKRKAAEKAWDFGLHLANLRSALAQPHFGVLSQNAIGFCEFMSRNEKTFKDWLSGSLTTGALTDSYIAGAHGYRSGESARQAVQKLQRHTTVKRQAEARRSRSRSS
jgi:hypothetical protein